MMRAPGIEGRVVVGAGGVGGELEHAAGRVDRAGNAALLGAFLGFPDIDQQHFPAC